MDLRIENFKERKEVNMKKFSYINIIAILKWLYRLAFLLSQWVD